MSIRFKKRMTVLREVSMPKVTEAHLEARKQQITDAAAACFSRKGFHQTTMQDICREAELSPGAVYRYFTSKEQIIAAMVAERRSEGVGLIEAARRGHDDTLGALAEIADVFFSRLEDVQGCSVDIELWAEAQANPAIRGMLNTDACEVGDALAELIARAQDRGEISARLDPRAVAQVMNSMFQGLVLQRSIDPTVEVGPYVSVIKAMMGGGFWIRGKEGESDAGIRN
jgi:AcrR family transcriptional regulator